MTYCAPHVGGDELNLCMDKVALVKVAKTLRDKGYAVIVSGSKEDIARSISTALATKCQEMDEICWTKESKLFELQDEYFKPERPIKYNQWLSTQDIAKVMAHYQKLYPDFCFFGPLPRDFAQIASNLSVSKIKSLVKNDKKKRFGVIFNLDAHHQSGSHWVAMFIDFNDNVIEYFDSTGNKPLKEFSDFMGQMVKEFNLKTEINTTKHQRGNSECGVYSLFYITQRLNGVAVAEIAAQRIPDNVMLEHYRDVFFRPNEQTVFGGRKRAQSVGGASRRRRVSRSKRSSLSANPRRKNANSFRKISRGKKYKST